LAPKALKKCDFFELAAEGDGFGDFGVENAEILCFYPFKQKIFAAAEGGRFFFEIPKTFQKHCGAKSNLSKLPCKFEFIKKTGNKQNYWFSR
jgi:hypothetical protein